MHDQNMGPVIGRKVGLSKSPDRGSTKARHRNDRDVEEWHGV
jgi:hypothetical protein